MAVYNYRELEPVAPGDSSRGVSLRLLDEDAFARAAKVKVRALAVAPGGQTEPHAHVWAHELIVLRGAGALCGDGGEQPLEAGDVVDVPAGSRHQLCNAAAETLEVISLDIRR